MRSIDAKDGLEEEADAIEEVLVIDEGVEYVVEGESEADLEKKIDASGEAVPRSSEGCLDSHYENAASQSISTLPHLLKESYSLPVCEESKIIESGPGPADITELFDEKKEVIGADVADAVAVEADEDCIISAEIGCGQV